MYNYINANLVIFILAYNLKKSEKSFFINLEKILKEIH